jgi:sensor histidine kinase regulating citrate/malate metabolism
MQKLILKQDGRTIGKVIICGETPRVYNAKEKLSGRKLFTLVLLVALLSLLVCWLV